MTSPEKLVARPEDVRALVHLEADPVARPVEEAAVDDLAGLLRQRRRVPVLGEEVADQPHEVEAVDARPGRRRGAVEGLLREAVVLAQLLRDVSDDVRARHVGEDRGLAVAREDVEDDRLAGQDRAGAHVVPDRPLRAVGDYELVGERTVRAEHALDLDLQAFARKRIAAEDKGAAGDLRLAQHPARDVERRLACALCAPQPRELGRILLPAPALEVRAIAVDLDSVRAQMVGELERERRRRDRVRDTELLAGADVDLERRIFAGIPPASSSSIPKRSGGIVSMSGAALEMRSISKAVTTTARLPLLLST